MKLQQWFSTQICIFVFLNRVSVNARNWLICRSFSFILSILTLLFTKVSASLHYHYYLFIYLYVCSVSLSLLRSLVFVSCVYSESALLLCRSWTSWTSWQETSMWASAMPRECSRVRNKTDFNVFDRFLVYKTVLHLWGESQVSQQLPGSVWVHVTGSESHHEINLSLLSVWLSFQSERESGDRNFAIGYYLKEKKVRLDAADNWAGIFLFKRKFFFLLWTHYICDFILSFCILNFIFGISA